MLLVQPSEEMSKQIRVDLNEDPATRDKDLEIIKEWLAKQPHLPSFNDDQRLMTFLRGCKFSLEKCKKKLDMYFTMRGAVPEFFSNRNITRPEMKEITNIVQVPPLPGLTKNGRRVILMRGIDKDLPTPNVAEAMKLVLMIGDVRLKEESHGVAGDVYILDATVATPTHFAKFTPAIVKKFLVCVQEAYPVEYGGDAGPIQDIHGEIHGCCTPSCFAPVLLTYASMSPLLLPLPDSDPLSH